ncbi:Aste57867_236 [Aphanomyces stellatus]|uniref:Aste57867_236 protein n=1 Tax=Aphanomyces stellatus TaxID=120398 RepID=A0A485K3A2_9STRA|nr:hypothetical protein As57867_000236 [Aphanomyces stellatus]VFT77462.1 Aste57867_236 [Aphanomyces stellatus]
MATPTTPSKFAAFLASLKARGEAGPPTDICLSGLTYKIKGTRKPHEKEFVLFDINARFKPGSMTLVLGAPGCGKTSLLKAIAGVFATTPFTVSGATTFNGIAGSTMRRELRHLVSFAGQKDEHIPTLTVKETLAFAHACRNVHPSFDCEAGTAAIINMLGLDGCQHTLVGDDFVRGVSGGQRRRVSLGEMLTGQSPILLLDEYTTGLDTTVATEITQKLRDMCNALQYTVVTALLQPPPEVFALFDNVLILAAGHLAYFGTCADAVTYFNELGFLVPHGTDDADFLQEVTSVFGREFKDPVVPKIPNTALEFHQAFKESRDFAQLLIPKPHVTAVTGDGSANQIVPLPVDAPDKATARRPCKSLGHVIHMVFQRQLHLVSRDTKFNRIRFGQSLVMGLAIGSLFGELGTDAASVPSKVGLMFLTLLFTSVITLANIAYTIQLRGVFQKQYVFLLFPAWAYAAAESLFEALFTAIQALLFTCSTYWMCGFSSVENGAHYGTFFALIYLNSLAITQCFKCIAAFAPSAVVGLILGAATVFVLVIFSGFAIPGPSIPSYFVWLFNINPSSWAFWGVMLNEFRSPIPAYDAIKPIPHMRMGDFFVLKFGVTVDDRYIRWALGYLAGLYVFFALFTAIGYRFVRYTKRVTSVKSIQSDVAQVRPVQSAPSLDGSMKATQHAVTFTPVTLTFHSLYYTILMARKGQKKPEPVDLLSGIHGQFAPGTMTALMGTSGAGKSTLLDVLAGRKNSGKIKGVVRANSVPLTSAVQQQFGYVEQNDLHCLTATVQEALEFSAHLRLPADAKIESIIWSTLEILELDGDRNRRIADLSNEQAKRVTIGVELVANPSVLFLDEPTSGLDVHAAKVVCDAMQRISRSGRTVICTIHQPSFVLFEMFDALVLLRTGGKMVYFGPLHGGRAIVDYFEAIPGMRPLRPRENPATYMLDVMAANPQVDYTAVYTSSSLCTSNDTAIFAVAPNPDAKDKRKQSEQTASIDANGLVVQKANTMAAQFYHLGRRTMRKYWRTREYSIGRVLISIFVAIIFGILFQDDGGLAYTSQVQSQASLVFVGPLFMGIISVITGLPVVDAERMVFFRERASGMYATFPYALVFGLVEVPYVLVNSLVFSSIFYFMIDLKPDAAAFLWFYIYYCLYNLFATYLGQLLVAVLPDLRSAVSATGGVNSLVSLFAGFFIHKNSIPDAWRFMYWMSPLHYTLEGMMATQYLDNQQSIFVGSKGAILSPANVTVATFINEMFGGGISLDNKVTNVGILAAIVVVVKTGAFLAQQFLTFVTR